MSETELQTCVWSCQSGTMVQLQRKDGNSHSCWLQTRLSDRCRGACRPPALWRSPAGIWGLYPSERGIIHHSITLSLAFNLPRYQPVWVSGGGSERGLMLVNPPLVAQASPCPSMPQAVNELTACVLNGNDTAFTAQLQGLGVFLEGIYQMLMYHGSSC